MSSQLFLRRGWNRAFVNLLDIDLHPFDVATIQDRPADSLLAIVEQVMTARLVSELNLTTESGILTSLDGEDE